MKGTNEKKTRRHSKRFVGFMIAAAVAASVPVAAIGYGIYVDHKQNVDSYLGAGAADDLENKGLFDGTNIAENEHFRITKETILSTGNTTSMIVTIEGVDDEGRELLDSGDKCLSLSFGDIIRHLGNNVKGMSSSVDKGSGYITYMYNIHFSTLMEPVETEARLFIYDSEQLGKPESEEGINADYVIGRIKFTTEKNTDSETFFCEQNGRSIELYQFAMTSEDNIAIEKADSQIELIYSDGSTEALISNSFNSLVQPAADEVSNLADGETQLGTQAVFNRLIDITDVTSVVINGDEYTKQ